MRKPCILGSCLPSSSQFWPCLVKHHAPQFAETHSLHNFCSGSQEPEWIVRRKKESVNNLQFKFLFTSSFATSKGKSHDSSHTLTLCAYENLLLGYSFYYSNLYVSWDTSSQTMTCWWSEFLLPIVTDLTEKWQHYGYAETQRRYLDVAHQQANVW